MLTTRVRSVARADDALDPSLRAYSLAMPDFATLAQEMSPIEPDAIVAASVGPYGACCADGSEYTGAYAQGIRGGTMSDAELASWCSWMDRLVGMSGKRDHEKLLKSNMLYHAPIPQFQKSSSFEPLSHWAYMVTCSSAILSRHSNLGCPICILKVRAVSVLVCTLVVHFIWQVQRTN